MTKMVKNRGELSATEACRMLGTSIDFIYRLIRSGKLPCRKVDRLWLIPQQAIEARIAKRELRKAA
jgi:excisionase family DNA binding protein